MVKRTAPRPVSRRSRGPGEAPSALQRMIEMKIQRQMGKAMMRITMMTLPLVDRG